MQVYSVQCTLYSLHCTVYNVNCFPAMLIVLAFTQSAICLITNFLKYKYWNVDTIEYIDRQKKSN